MTSAHAPQNRRRAPISAQSLEGVREFILELFISEDKTDKEVRAVLRRDKNIDLSHPQLERALRVWGVRKNLSGQEWKAVLSQWESVQKHHPGSNVHVRISGHDVNQSRLNRARERYMSLPQDALEGCPAGVSIGIYAVDGAWVELIKPGTPNYRGQSQPMSTTTITQVPSLAGSHQVADTSSAMASVLNGRWSRSSKPRVEVFDVLSALRARCLLDQDVYDTRDMVFIDSGSIRNMARDTSFARFMTHFESDVHSLSVQLQSNSEALSTLKGILGTLVLGKHILNTNVTVAAQQSLQGFMSTIPRSLAAEDGHPADEPSIRTVFRLILYSLANGFSGMTPDAEKRLMNCMQTCDGFGKFLARFLARNHGSYAKAMAETLFQAAIDSDDCDTVSILLESRLVAVDRVKFRGGFCGLSRAAFLGHTSMIQLLLRYGADPNTNFFHRHNDKQIGTLQALFDCSDGTSSVDLAIMKHLIDAHAKVPISVLMKMLSRAETEHFAIGAVLRADAEYLWRTVEYQVLGPILKKTDKSIHAVLIKRLVSGWGAFKVNLDRHTLKAFIFSTISAAIDCGSKDAVELLMTHFHKSSLTNISLEKHDIQTLMFWASYTKQNDIFKILAEYSSDIMFICPSAAQAGQGWWTGHTLPTRTTQYALAILAQDDKVAKNLENSGAVDSEDYAFFGYAWLAAVQIQDVDRLRKFKEQGHIDEYLRMLQKCSRQKREKWLHCAVEAALAHSLKLQDPDLAFQVLSIAAQTTTRINTGIDVLSTDIIWQWPDVLKSVVALSGDISPATLINVHRRSSHLGFMERESQHICLQAFKWNNNLVMDIVAPILKSLPKSWPNLYPEVLSKYLETHRLGLVEQLRASGLVNDHTLDYLFAHLVRTGDEVRAGFVLDLIEIPLNRSLEAAVRARRHDFLEKLLTKAQSKDGQTLQGFGTISLIIAVEQQPVDLRIVNMLVGCPVVDIFGYGSLDPLAMELQLYDAYVKDEDGSSLPPFARFFELASWDQYNWCDTVLMAAISGIQKNRSEYKGLLQRLFQRAPNPILIMHGSTCALPTTGPITFLQKHPSTGSSTHFLEAIGSGDVSLVQQFLEHGAEVNHFPTNAQESPLQKAARSGHLSVVKLLLQQGADVNALPAVRGGLTALQAGAGSGCLAVVETLLEHGANLYMAPAVIDGRGPLEAAAEKSRFDMIDFLWRASDFCGRRFDQPQIVLAIHAAADSGYQGCADRLTELMQSWPEGEVAPISKVSLFDGMFEDLVTEEGEIIDMTDIQTPGRDDWRELFPGGLEAGCQTPDLPFAIHGSPY